MALISLVYVSFASDKDISEEELKDILKVARENNQSLDVTGMLLYRNGFFIQDLEGEDEVVTTLYEKIKQDPRHRNILVIYKNRIQQRAFQDWSMGFQQIENKDLKDLEGFNAFLDKPFTAEFFHGNPSHAQTLLNTFKIRNTSRF